MLIKFFLLLLTKLPGGGQGLLKKFLIQVLDV